MGQWLENVRSQLIPIVTAQLAQVNSIRKCPGYFRLIGPWGHQRSVDSNEWFYSVFREFKMICQPTNGAIGSFHLVGVWGKFDFEEAVCVHDDSFERGSSFECAANMVSKH